MGKAARGKRRAVRDESKFVTERVLAHVRKAARRRRQAMPGE
ncbi:hypothetical protein OV203_31005 [Nannocystis sp. ILAH1]|nr:MULTISPECIES: hypothetical protein [unclassified Nannocystis]MCY0991612.1 hypothetical protein [Nannocystis sp. ILAH1]MCY1066660.1 hypothetical protein [Nannocystis sp. RBIL2]